MKISKQLKSIVSMMALTAGFLFIPVEGYAQTANEAVPDSMEYDISAFDSLLDEVQIVAIKPMVKAEADKLTYDVKSDSDSKTYTVLEMLRKVPMVSVDGEDNIAVNGSSSFQVYVNGRPSLMYSNNPGQIFKSMPATMVKSIEVITNPGARYDAEGAGGVLNLVMDQPTGGSDNDGYTLGIGAHAGTRGFDGNVNFAGQTGRLSFSGNAMYNRMNPGDSDLSNDQVMPDRTVKSHIVGKPALDFTMGSLSADYAVSDRTSIGLAGAINGFGMDTKTTSLTQMTFNDGTSDLNYSGSSDMNINRLSVNGSLSVNHDFKDTAKSSLSLIYQISHEKNKTENVNDFMTEDTEDTFLNLSDRVSRNRENTLDNTVQADFTTHPVEGHVLDAGLKLTARNAHSVSSLLMEEESGNEDTRYRNNTDILAAYAEYSLPAGAFSLKGGLRYEYTWQRVKYDMASTHEVDRNYGILVPSASIGYRLPSAGTLALTYNMRISRPGISYLNPFEDHSSPLSVSFGNPDLDVEKTHNVGVSYNLFTPKFMLNTRLSDSYTGNGIESYSYVADGMPTTTYGNVAKRNLLRLDASAVWGVSSKTRLILNGSVGYASLSNSRMNLHNEGWQWNAVAGLQQTFPWNVKGSLYLIGSSKSYTIDGWRSGFNLLSINLSKTFLSDRLSVSAGFTSGLSKGGKMNIDNYTYSSGLQTGSHIRVPILGVTVGVSYTFGNYSQKQKANKKSLDSDYIEQRSDLESLSGQGKFQ